MIIASLCVFGAAISVVWVKAAKTVSIPATAAILIVLPLVMCSGWSMHSQLNTNTPQSSTLTLRAEGQEATLAAASFKVGEDDAHVQLQGKASWADACVGGREPK